MNEQKFHFSLIYHFPHWVPHKKMSGKLINRKIDDNLQRRIFHTQKRAHWEEVESERPCLVGQNLLSFSFNLTLKFIYLHRREMRLIQHVKSHKFCCDNALKLNEVTKKIPFFCTPAASPEFSVLHFNFRHKLLEFSLPSHHPQVRTFSHDLLLF